MVYVDNMNAPYGDMIMCHMIADSSEELLAMADKIGVKRKWIQYPGTDHEHFDICLSKKKLALKAGAQEISMLELSYIRKGLQRPGSVRQLELMAVETKQEHYRTGEIDLAGLVQHWEQNPDFKGKDDFTVKVKDIVYRIPHYCLANLLWGMPDNFYPCDKYEWADHAVYFTSIEMVKNVISADPDRFKSFVFGYINGEN